VKIKLISILLLTLACSNLLAEEKKSSLDLTFNDKINLFMEIGVQGGGDGSEPLPVYDRASGLYFTGIPLTLVGNWNGIDSDLQQFWEDEAEAGGLYKFAVGAEFPLGENFSVMTSIGYLFDEVQGDLLDGSGGQGSFQFLRTTIELIPFYQYGRHRIGLGAEMHMSPKAVHKEYASTFSLKSTYDFDDAVGAVLRYDYLVNKNTSVGFKYADMSYDFDEIRTRYTVGTAVIDDIQASCTANCGELLDASAFGIHLTYRF